jgi:hypothetical protein
LRGRGNWRRQGRGSFGAWYLMPAAFRRSLQPGYSPDAQTSPKYPPVFLWTCLKQLASFSHRSPSCLEPWPEHKDLVRALLAGLVHSPRAPIADEAEGRVASRWGSPSRCDMMQHWCQSAPRSRREVAIIGNCHLGMIFSAA